MSILVCNQRIVYCLDEINDFVLVFISHTIRKKTQNVEVRGQKAEISEVVKNPWTELNFIVNHTLQAEESEPIVVNALQEVIQVDCELSELESVMERRVLSVHVKLLIIFELRLVRNF